MSQSYTRMVKTVGDANIIFDRMTDLLRAKGFRVISAEKPSLIVADRGLVRPTRKFWKSSHSLVIAFHKMDDCPALSFTYIMSDMWDRTPGDEIFMNNEINDIVGNMNMNTSIIDVTMVKDRVSQPSATYN
jgi:hypothetical protein